MEPLLVYPVRKFQTEGLARLCSLSPDNFDILSNAFGLVECWTVSEDEKNWVVWDYKVNQSLFNHGRVGCPREDFGEQEDPNYDERKSVYLARVSEVCNSLRKTNFLERARVENPVFREFKAGNFSALLPFAVNLNLSVPGDFSKAVTHYEDFLLSTKAKESLAAESILPPKFGKVSFGPRFYPELAFALTNPANFDGDIFLLEGFRISGDYSSNGRPLPRQTHWLFERTDSTKRRYSLFAKE